MMRLILGLAVIGAVFFMSPLRRPEPGLEALRLAAENASQGLGDPLGAAGMEAALLAARARQGLGAAAARKPGRPEPGGAPAPVR